MKIVKQVEVKGRSGVRWEDTAQRAIQESARAMKTIEAKLPPQRVRTGGDDRVNAKISFTWDT